MAFIKLVFTRVLWQSCQCYMQTSLRNVAGMAEFCVHKQITAECGSLNSSLSILKFFFQNLFIFKNILQVHFNNPTLTNPSSSIQSKYFTYLYQTYICTFFQKITIIRIFWAFLVQQTYRPQLGRQVTLISKKREIPVQPLSKPSVSLKVRSEKLIWLIHFHKSGSRGETGRNFAPGT